MGHKATRFLSSRQITREIVGSCSCCQRPLGSQTAGRRPPDRPYTPMRFCSSPDDDWKSWQYPINWKMSQKKSVRNKRRRGGGILLNDGENTEKRPTVFRDLGLVGRDAPQRPPLYLSVEKCSTQWEIIPCDCSKKIEFLLVREEKRTSAAEWITFCSTTSVTAPTTRLEAVSSSTMM